MRFTYLGSRLEFDPREKVQQLMKCNPSLLLTVDLEECVLYFIVLTAPTSLGNVTNTTILNIQKGESQAALIH